MGLELGFDVFEIDHFEARLHVNGTLLSIFQFRYLIEARINVVVGADIFVFLGPRIHRIDRFDRTLEWILLDVLLFLSVFFLADAVIDKPELIVNRHLVQLRHVLKLGSVYFGEVVAGFGLLRSVLEPASEYIGRGLKRAAVLALFEHFVDDDSIGELL